MKTLRDHVMDYHGRVTEAAKAHDTSRENIYRWMNEQALVIDGEIYIKARNRKRK